MDGQSYGLLENYKDLGVGIIEFAIDDYISTAKSLNTQYRKLNRCFEEGFKARKFHERLGDVCLAIYHRQENLHEIETFLTGDWVKKLTDMDIEMLFQETKNRLKRKGYRVELMGLRISTDEKGVTIFANEKEGQFGKFTLYSIGVSAKDKEGNGWINGYVPCRFKKGITVENKQKIKINSGFVFPSKYNDKPQINVMITDFDILNADSPADEFMKIPEGIDEDVPFL